MNVNKLIFILLFFLSFDFVRAQRIKGSDTVLPLTQQIAERYMREYPERSVTVTGGGTGVGLSSIYDHTTDIAMASRQIKFGERLKLKKARQEIREVEVAYDALAVIVHPSNPVNRLTREQLDGIFRGKITNWKQVGGEDRRIVVYSRETSSGTYEFFKESVLGNKNYMSSILSMPATGAIIQSVRQTRGAIGYVGLAYLNRYVKPIAVSYDRIHFYTPSLENAIRGKYPIVRPLYYYYNQADSAKVLPFIEYILSPKGQEMVKKNGFVPLI